jgi:SagB-type dehydrogenase family enzyme
MIAGTMRMAVARLVWVTPMWAACAVLAAEESADIRLPPPQTKEAMSVAEALAKRRSHQPFADRPLSIEQVSQLCWAAQGITDLQRGKRTAPSAGALYPLTVFVIDRNGVYEYQPKEHLLHRVLEGDIRDKLPQPKADKPGGVPAPVSLLVTMDTAKTAARFKDQAERYCLLESGHVAQNVLLEATAMGLVSTPLGGVDEKKMAELVKLPEGLRASYLLPVGYPVAP